MNDSANTNQPKTYGKGERSAGKAFLTRNGAVMFSHEAGSASTIYQLRDQSRWIELDGELEIHGGDPDYWLAPYGDGQ